MVEETKKIRDREGLIIYSVVSVITLILGLYYVKFAQIYDSFSMVKFRSYTLMMGGFMGYTLLLIYAYPNFLIHFQGSAFPLLNIILGFQSNPVPNFMFAIVFFIGEFLLYINTFKDTAYYLSIGLKYGGKIIYRNILGCIAVFLAMCLFMFIYFLFLSGMATNESGFMLNLSIGMLYFVGLWTFLIMINFLRIFVSGLFAKTLTNESNDSKLGIFKKSLIHTIYSLGSICTYTLVTCLVEVLKIFINFKKDKKYNHRNVIIPNIFSRLFPRIIELYKNYITDFNDLTLSYISIHEENYKNSMINTSVLLNTTEIKPFYDTSIILPYNLFNIVLFGGLILSHAIFVNSESLNLKTGIDKRYVLSLLPYGLFYTSVFAIFINIFYSACYALIYFQILSPQRIFDEFPKLKIVSELFEIEKIEENEQKENTLDNKQQSEIENEIFKESKV